MTLELSDFSCPRDPTLPKCDNCKVLVLRRLCPNSPCPQVTNGAAIQFSTDIENDLPEDVRSLIDRDGSVGALKPGHYNTKS